MRKIEEGGGVNYGKGGWKLGERVVERREKGREKGQGLSEKRVGTRRKGGRN